jgi:Flp pilus assembly protein TadB
MEASMKFRDKVAQFMYGRRGTDDFARFLLVVTLVFIVLSWLTGGILKGIFQIIAIAALIYCYVRILSRDIYKRQQENAWYLKQKQAVRRWIQSLKDRWQQRKDYKFFRCPSCHTLLRVPKGKGKLLLTCRKCGNRFERKT